MLSREDAIYSSFGIKEHMSVIRLNRIIFYNYGNNIQCLDGFGGLVVSMLASGTQV